MMKLFCVLSFDLDSVFSVQLDETSTVKDLKTAIKATKPQAIPGNLKAGKLQVYLGQHDGKWLTSTSIQNLNFDSLHLEQLKLSDKTLERAGLSENATAQPSDEEIAQGGGYVHLVVVVPQGKLIELIYPERTMQMAEQLIKKREMRDVLTCADCSVQQVEELKKKLGLSTKLLEVEESEDDSVPGFDWSGNTCNQGDGDVREKYIAYMNDGLSFHKLQLNTRQQFFLEDTAAKKVLSISGASWMKVDINDTADLFIVDRLARHYRLPFAGLRFIVEVKRDLLQDTEGYIREALLKLIVADFKSDKRRAPVGLLTDLNTAWYFFWFTAEQEIATLLLRYPAHGFQFVKDILSGDSPPSAQGIYMMSCSFLNDQPALKRRKLL